MINLSAENKLHVCSDALRFGTYRGRARQGVIGLFIGSPFWGLSTRMAPTEQCSAQAAAYAQRPYQRFAGAEAQAARG